MIRDFYIASASVDKNAQNVSAAVKAANSLAQGSVVDLAITAGVREASQPADLAGAQAAEYIIINADSGKEQFDTYVEDRAGITLEYAPGEYVRAYRLKSLEGLDAIVISREIVSADCVAGDTIIPLFDGGWSKNAVVTGYAYYLKVTDVFETERGATYLCEVVVA